MEEIQIAIEKNIQLILNMEVLRTFFLTDPVKRQKIDIDLICELTSSIPFFQTYIQ